jgi:hypothetical protein
VAAGVCLEGSERGSHMESSELKHKTFHAVLWALVRVGASNVFTVGFSHRGMSLFLLLPSWWSTSRIVSSAGLSSELPETRTGSFWPTPPLGPTWRLGASSAP